MPLVELSAGFQSLPLPPTSKLGPYGADSQAAGFVYVLGPCGSPRNSPVSLGVFSHCHNPYRHFQSEALRLYFPRAGTLVCVVCLASQLFLLVYLHANVGLPVLPAAALPTPLASAFLWVLSAPAAYLCPSY